VQRYLSVLRGQSDELVKSAASSKSRRVSMVSMVSEATQLGGQLAERNMHEKFFDVKWAAQRRFNSGSAAYLATRVLLQQRVQDAQGRWSWQAVTYPAAPAGSEAEEGELPGNGQGEAGGDAAAVDAAAS
jgi:hypothetical protein